MIAGTVGVRGRVVGGAGQAAPARWTGQGRRGEQRRGISTGRAKRRGISTGRAERGSPTTRPCCGPWSWPPQAQEWGADVPVGAVVLDADGRVIGGARQRARGAGDPTAHAEVLALRAAAAVHGAVAAERLHARGHAGAVHDVRRRDRAVPGRRGWSSARGTRRPARWARCGTSYGTGGSTTGPRSSAECWPRSARRCCDAFFADGRDRPWISAPRRTPVISPAVACPSGLRSTPRKRVMVHRHRGFKSHRHRQSLRVCSCRSGDLPCAGADASVCDRPRHACSGRGNPVVRRTSLKIKRCVVAVSAVAGLMAVGSGTASAVPANGSAEPPCGTSGTWAVLAFFGSSIPNDDPLCNLPF